MKTNVSKSDFRDAFKRMGRENNFGYDGLGALYDFIEELYSGTGTESELDVIALCCEFNEYENIDEFWQDYNDKDTYETIEDIENHTSVIRIDGSDSFIIQAF